MLSPIGSLQVAAGPWTQRTAGGPSARVGRLLLVASLAAIALFAVAGTVAANAATPTVTGVTPNTGPPAGGTTVTVTGSGFALGTSATRITFGEEGEEAEAAGVNCTTTTECTATAPKIFSSENSYGVVDVRATVGGMESPATVADQFEYHGLFLLYKNEPLRVGGEGVRMFGAVFGGEFEHCSSHRVFGGIASNGQTTDVLNIGAEALEGCEGLFGVLPFSFSLHLGDDGSATVEGPVGWVTFEGCVYEGDGMAGQFALPIDRLDTSLSGTLALVREEHPGAECAATEHVRVILEPHEGFEALLIGAPLPSVSGLSPSSGPKAGGTSVTLTGLGLGEASAVKFGSEEASSFTVNSPTSITAVSPPGEGTVAVTVTAPRGTGSSAGGGDKFTYGPAVSAIEPDHGPKAGETTVTITGENLGEASAVTFGTTPAASFTVVSPTSLTAVSPPGTGTVDVTVTTPEGTSPTGAQDRFSYDVTPPAITAMKPKGGPITGGTKVKIEGANFTGATEVKFGPTRASSFTVGSDSVITAISPPGATAGPVGVTVTTAKDGTSEPSLFIYKPVVTGVSPNAGLTTGGTTITVSGLGFLPGATRFTFGKPKVKAAKATSVNCTSTTECTVVTPTYEAGTVDVKAQVFYAPKKSIGSPRNAADQFTYE